MQRTASPPGESTIESTKLRPGKLPVATGGRHQGSRYRGRLL
ncbi:MAG: hypothetical protein WAP05_04520 [Dethiobacteria bacterium]|nr:hypothetical protein [Bacillota bacterium]